MKFYTLLAGLAIVLTDATSAHAVTIIDLGPAWTAGGPFGKPLTINGAGLVAGVLSSGGQPQPFTWQSGVMTDLTTPAGATNMQVTGVNDQGQVVGMFTPAGGSQLAITWQNGVRQTLPVPAGYSGSLAYGINDAGQIVGAIFSSSSSSTAVLWSSSTSNPTSLGPAGSTVAFGINDAGQVVGGSPGFTPNIGFSWQSGVVTNIGSPAGNFQPLSINSSGQIGGYFYGSTQSFQAGVWQTNSLLSLGKPDGASESEATALNDKGQVVGLSDEEGGWLWQNGQMITLNDIVPPGPQWFFGPAWGISNNNQIVAGGELANGTVQALLVTVPEPSSVILAALGLVGLAAWGWRRKRA